MGDYMFTHSPTRRKRSTTSATANESATNTDRTTARLPQRRNINTTVRENRLQSNIRAITKYEILHNLWRAG